VRILITGSSGYLGRHLVSQCLDRGDEVIGVLHRNASGLEHVNYREAQCDITDREEITDLISSERPDVVVHSAAALSQFVPDEKRLHDINVNGTKYVVSAAFDAQVQQLIFLSSVEVYGVKVPIPCPETAPLHPDVQYGRDKVECEEFCNEYLKKGMNITIFRPPTITGPGQNEPTLLGQVKSVYEGKSIMLAGGGKTRLQMVNVLDVCHAILLAIDNPEAARGAVLNLGSDNVPTMRETAVALFEHAGKKPKFVNIGAGLARFIVKLLNPFHLSPVQPQHLEIALRDYMFDSTRAKDLLGWQPTKTDIESTNDTYDWYVNEVIHAGGEEYAD